MNIILEPENLFMFFLIASGGGFLTCFCLYQWRRNKKVDLLINQNEKLNETITKQGIAVNKAIDLLSRYVDDELIDTRSDNIKLE